MFMNRGFGRSRGSLFWKPQRTAPGRRDMDASTKNSTKSKIEILPFHPLADLFPLMQGEELEELAGDIQRRGLIEAITVSEHMIVDGRNRALACQKAGIEPRYTPYQRPAEDLPRFIISKNIHRRHLKPEQRRDLIKKVLAWDPERSDRAIAAELGIDHKTVSAVRKQVEATGEFSPVERRKGRDGKIRSQPTRKVKIPKPAVGGGDTGGDSHDGVASLIFPAKGRVALEFIAQPPIPIEQIALNEEVEPATQERAARAADRLMGKNFIRAKKRKLPGIDRFTEDTAMFLAGHLHDDKWKEKLNALVKYRTDIPTSSLHMLTKVLKGLAKRALCFAAKLEGDQYRPNHGGD